MSNTAYHPGSAALDAWLEATLQRGVCILSTALVLIGLPMWLVMFCSVPAGSQHNGLFNPDANLTVERMLSVPEGSFIDGERFDAKYRSAR